ncbi:MAG TPA: glycosyltransferase family 2 protein [Thermoanaerobaculia bacterium]|nr:glycosyltransferase family 2 protein [Thermoanaerobaculia bacterium]
MADAVLTEIVSRPSPAPAAAVELSILIVTWNSERWIERCLRAIPAACGELGYEIVLYDNASTDRTLSRTPGGARILFGPTNDGFAAAMNRAAERARGPYLFFLNPDCELGPGSLSELVAFMRAHPEAAAAAPLLADARGTSQREFQLRRFPTVWSFAVEILAIEKLIPSNPITARYRYRDLDLGAPRRVDQPAAAALLLRRDVFEEIGRLDERFFPAWFEDVDYCRRLAAAGKAVWVVPTAHAQHAGGASLEHMPFARFVDLWYANLWRYARKWFTPGEAEALRWIIIAGMVLRIPAAMAGIAHAEVGRWNAVRAYAAALKKAFNRWDDTSPS